MITLIVSRRRYFISALFSRLIVNSAWCILNKLWLILNNGHNFFSQKETAKPNKLSRSTIVDCLPTQKYYDYYSIAVLVLLCKIIKTAALIDLNTLPNWDRMLRVEISENRRWKNRNSETIEAELCMRSFCLMETALFRVKRIESPPENNRPAAGLSGPNNKERQFRCLERYQPISGILIV